MSPDQYRKERKARGLTQAELAALLGIQRETVVRREAGEVEITREMALALAALQKTKRRTGTSNDGTQRRRDADAPIATETRTRRSLE